MSTKSNWFVVVVTVHSFLEEKLLTFKGNDRKLASQLIADCAAIFDRGLLPTDINDGLYDSIRGQYHAIIATRRGMEIEAQVVSALSN